MPTQRGGFEFEEVLPRLVAAYESGRLVPFIGVGMSRPLCADWPGLIRGLEQQAGITGGRAITWKTKSEELIQRANRAIACLRHDKAGRLAEGLFESLFPGRSRIPPQTTKLAGLSWPLVLTTNYDNAYVAAYEKAFGPGSIAVVGRGAEDCQRVLNSLSTAGRSILWALQGHLGQPFKVSTQAHDSLLASQAIVDHAEYRRVTHREPHFRRAFAEVFRHRSLFFLGSGLRESYLQDLFGEVLEIYGPSTRTHFAIMPRREVDPRFMYERFQIAVVEYKPGAHGEPPRMVGELKSAIDTSVAVPVAWSWGAIEHRSKEHARDVLRSDSELEIVRGPLPRVRADGECLVVSAGGLRRGSAFVLSSKAESTIRATLEAWGVKDGEAPRRLRKDGFVGKFKGVDAYAVRARPYIKDAKDLSQIAPAARALFDIAARKHSCIRMQLLAAGGDESRGPSYSVRPFPPRFSFIQIVREWGLWRRRHPNNRCKLALHVVDTRLCRDISSGRIDVLEILRCDDIRFWAEVVDGPDKFERQLFQLRPDASSLRTVCDVLCLATSEWRLEVSPPPTKDPKDFQHARLGKRLLDSSLEQLLVVPGSTLHFRRRHIPTSGAR